MLSRSRTPRFGDLWCCGIADSSWRSCNSFHDGTVHDNIISTSARHAAVTVRSGPFIHFHLPDPYTYTYAALSWMNEIAAVSTSIHTQTLLQTRDHDSYTDYSSSDTFTESIVVW